VLEKLIIGLTIGSVALPVLGGATAAIWMAVAGSDS